MNRKRHNAGFTLIELMVAVVIVGILAALAYPSYRQYMLRTNRTEGMTALQQVAAKQERFFSNNSTYTEDLADLNFSVATEHGYYTIEIEPGVIAGVCDDIARCYTLRANAQGGQTADAGCAILTLDSTGARGPAGCW
jgi:type IV pilus assembly protein PilE